MQVREIYDHRLYRGHIDDVKYILTNPHNFEEPLILNGNENGGNLIPINQPIELDEYMGTILSPAQWLRFKGILIPGLIYHRLVEIKQVISIKEGEIVDEGLMWDLTPFASHLHMLTQGRVELDKLRDLLGLELAKRHFDITDRHEGPVLRSAVVFDPRIPEDEVGASIPMVEEFYRKTGIELHSGCPMIFTRFPVIDSQSIQILTLRIIEDELLSWRVSDKMYKSMGGDFDGDCSPATTYPNQEYELLENLGPLLDPTKFIEPIWTLSGSKSFVAPTGVQTASGMTAKYLQGIITNMFKRIGILGLQLTKEGK
jgi:hypothetical protein